MFTLPFVKQISKDMFTLPSFILFSKDMFTLPAVILFSKDMFTLSLFILFSKDTVCLPCLSVGVEVWLNILHRVGNCKDTNKSFQWSQVLRFSTVNSIWLWCIRDKERVIHISRLQIEVFQKFYF